jgi:hypothetical protein
VTPLDSIEVFTMTDNIRLYEVFQSFLKRMKAKWKSMGRGARLIIKTITKNVLPACFPEYDKDRVLCK